MNKCGYCGNEFPPKNGRGRLRKWCNHKCRHSYYYKPIPKVKKNCKYCEKQFVATCRRAYCCDNCRRMAFHFAQREGVVELTVDLNTLVYDPAEGTVTLKACLPNTKSQGVTLTTR